jgi:membrane-associated protease RseP (regulator of RpoE activity)
MATNFVEMDVQPAIAGLIRPAKIERTDGGAIVVHGRLLVPADAVYRPLRARLEPLGYTPFLRPDGDGVELIAVPGVIERQPLRWRLNLAMFLITVVTVLLTGAMAEANTLSIVPLLRNPALLLGGFPFALTLLAILVTHEMGHFVVSRFRQAPASLPFFIPMVPGLTYTGTLGAVIVQREPFEDRRTLLEVAIAGPLAGLAVALPLLIYGLATSPLGPTGQPGFTQEGNSVLYALAKLAVFGQWLPGNGVDVQLNTVAWGAWIGLLVTMFNLLPIGQLDGGHIAYALFGTDANLIAYVMMGVCLLLGIFISPAWLIWLVLIALMGPRHPAPFNDVLRLRPPHIALGVLGLITFLVLFMPNPLS